MFGESHLHDLQLDSEKRSFGKNLINIKKEEKI